MKKYVLFAIIAVVIVSGCVSQAGTTPTRGDGYGIEITEFYTDTSDVLGGQSVHPVLVIENQGQDDVSKGESMALIIVPGDWDVKSGPSVSKDSHKVAKFSKNLKAANPTTGAPADSDILRWTIQSPELEKGEERTDTMFSKIYYDYETTSKGKVWVYPESERADENKITSSDTFVSSTGPINIEVAIVPDPPILQYDGERFVVEILLTNVGGGTPYSTGIVSYDQGYSISEDDRNNISLRVIPSGGNINVVEDSCPSEVLLVNDQATIFCDINITTGISTKQSYPLEVRASYGYTTEEEISVTIKGK